MQLNAAHALIASKPVSEPRPKLCTERLTTFLESNYGSYERTAPRRSENHRMTGSKPKNRLRIQVDYAGAAAFARQADHVFGPARAVTGFAIP